MKSLDEFSALESGSELWIVTELSKSKWARKIDWYLNCQIARAESHQFPEISDGLKQVMETVSFDAPLFEADPQAALLIASADLLPNSKTLLLPFNGDASDWVSKCHSNWMSLQRPLTRVFLPEGVSEQDFIRAWPSKDRQAAIEIVSDHLLPTSANSINSVNSVNS